MGKLGQIFAILAGGAVLISVVKLLLDTLYDSMVADLPGLTTVESLVIQSYPYAIVLAMAIGICLVIKGPRKKE